MASKVKDQVSSVGEEQGVEELLRNSEMMTPSNLEVKEDDQCRKNVGEQVRLQRYNRGIFASCSGGGHIWSFDVLYNSEGPTQAALLIIKYLMKRLKNVDPEEWKSYFVNYDNMCNVTRLRLLQGPLALPEPFSTIFLDVQ